MTSKIPDPLSSSIRHSSEEQPPIPTGYDENADVVSKLGKETISQPSSPSKRRDSFSDEEDLGEPAKETAEKTTGFLGTMFGWVTKKATHVGMAYAIRNHLPSYAHSMDTDKRISSAKQKMYELTQDTQYIAFYEFISAILVKNLGDFLKSSLKENAEILEIINGSSNPLELQNNLGVVIDDVIRINVANIFVNLMKNHQPGKHPLVEVIQIISEVINKHVDLNKLANLTPDNKARKKELIQELFQNPTRWEKKLLEELGHHIQNASERNRILLELFPHYYDTEESIRDTIDDLIRNLQDEAKRKSELQSLFSKASEGLVSYFFPNKLNDIALPIPGMGGESSQQYRVVKYIFDVIYKFLPVENFLTDFLIQSYEPMADDRNRINKWKETIQSRLPGVQSESIDTVIKAPALLITELAKEFIESDPRVVATLGESLKGLREGVVEGPKNKQKETMKQFENEQLASWIVTSAQKMLNTKDESLDHFGYFINSVFSTLTLGVISKATDMAIPAGTQLSEGELVKVLIDRISTHFKSGQSISKETWENIVRDLPLPPFVQGIVANLLAEQEKNQTGLTDIKKQIEDLYNQSRQKVTGYPNGQELLSISDKIADTVVSQVLEKNLKLMEAMGLEDLINDIFAQYLPGVKIDQHFKDFLDQNLNALSKTNSEPVTILKDGIRAIVLKSLVTTIEKNNADGKDFIATLLGRMHSAFGTAFENMSPANMKGALKILEQITLLKESKAVLLKEIKDTKASIHSDQTLQLLQTKIRLQEQLDKVKNFSETLKEQVDKLAGNLGWKRTKLQNMKKALSSHGGLWSEAEKLKTQHNMSTDKAAFEMLREHYQKAMSSVQKDKERITVIHETIEACSLIIEFLSLPEKQLAKATEVLREETTLQFSLKKQKYLNEQLANLELKIKEQSIRPELQEKPVNIQRNREEIAKIDLELAKLEKGLKSKLENFRKLAHELTDMIGLGDKDDLLPPFLKDQITPLINEAKDNQIALLLFEQICPMMQPILEIEEQRRTLDPLSVQMSSAITKEVFSRIPTLVTSYKPFAKEILLLIQDQVTDQEAESFAMRIPMAFKLVGKKHVTLDDVKDILQSKVAQSNVDELCQQVFNLFSANKFNKYEVEQILGFKDPAMTSVMDEFDAMITSKGKRFITSKDILSLYGQIYNQDQVLKDIQDQKILDRILTVVVTPEEIAQALNSLIPGAHDLHTLVAPQLQAAITGNDPSFVGTRKVIQDYLEGILLRIFSRIQKNNAGNVIEIVTQKINSIVTPDFVRGKTPEQATNAAIDIILNDILGIKSVHDFEGIPPILRQIVLDKSREQLKLQLAPLMTPVVEMAFNQRELQKLSGSPLLGKLAIAMAQDIKGFIPTILGSYQTVAKHLCAVLEPGVQPTDEFIEVLTKQIVRLTEKARTKPEDPAYKPTPVTNHALVEAYGVAKDQILHPNEKKRLQDLLEKSKVKAELTSVLFAPEELMALVSGELKSLQGPIAEQLTTMLREGIASNSSSYQSLTGFLEAYLQGFVTKLFIKMTQKNPPEAGKDVIYKVSEKLLSIVTTYYPAMKAEPAKDVSRKLTEQILKDIFGIGSERDLEELPTALQLPIYQVMRDQISAIVSNTIEHIQKNSDTSKLADSKKKFEERICTSAVDVVVHDLGKLIVDLTPASLAEVVGGKVKGATLISEGLHGYLEELSRTNTEMAKILLTYAEGAPLQQWLGQQLQDLASPANLQPDKLAAASFVGDILLVPLQRAFSRLLDVEEFGKEKFNQKLITNVFDVMAKHFAVTNAVRKDKKNPTHADLVAEAKKQGYLHAATPTEAISYTNVINEISERLGFHSLSPRHRDFEKKLEAVLRRLVKEDETSVKPLRIEQIENEINQILSELKLQLLDEHQLIKLEKVDDKGSLIDLIRREVNANKTKELKHFYQGETKAILRAMFPNGRNDLTFVPPELRGTVWKTLKNQLGPMILPMLFEMIIDRDMISTMLLSSLETARESMKGMPTDYSGFISEVSNLLKIIDPVFQKKLDNVLVRMDREGKLDTLIMDALIPEINAILKGMKKAELSPDQKNQLFTHRNIKKLTPIETLRQEMARAKYEAAHPELNALDESTGRFMGELLKMLDLPSSVTTFLYDQDGKISPLMQKTIGGTLRAQFTETFMKETLKTAFDKLAERDPTGKPFVSTDSSKPTDEEVKAKKAKMEEDLARVTREVVDEAISYGLRNQWRALQVKLDKTIQRLTGKYGMAIKHALDATFKFIFYTILGTIFELLTRPIRPWLKNRVYNFIKLDKNREALLDALRKAPVEQPEEGNFVTFNKNLAFKLADAIGDAITG